MPTSAPETEYYDAETALLKMAMIMIEQEIDKTNNGKLMIMRLDRELRRYIPTLIKSGKLKRATFMNPGDSIRLS